MFQNIISCTFYWYFWLINELPSSKLLKSLSNNKISEQWDINNFNKIWQTL